MHSNELINVIKGSKTVSSGPVKLFHDNFAPGKKRIITCPGHITISLKATFSTPLPQIDKVDPVTVAMEIPTCHTHAHTKARHQCYDTRKVHSQRS